jgi:hypothetical protein
MIVAIVVQRTDGRPPNERTSPRSIIFNLLVHLQSIVEVLVMLLTFLQLCDDHKQ